MRRTCGWLVVAAMSGFLGVPQASYGQAQPPTKAPKKPAMGPPAPQSKHYPILILAFGTDPSWSLRIGQKGPERLDRPNYPPIPLEPGEVTHESSDSWIYHAKDSATGAAVAIHLARESCEGTTPTAVSASSAPSPSPSPSLTPKFTFTASVDHVQLGTLKGCARIAAELFPKITNQQEQEEDDDDTDKKPPPPPPNFKSPVAIAFVNPSGNVVLSRGGVRRTIATSAFELSLSHDGKKLLYTRTDSKSENTIVLYDFDSGTSKDLLIGHVRQAFWSPDDSRIAFLKSQDHDWQVWTCIPATPEAATAFSPQVVSALHGWIDTHTLLASDWQNAYWLAEEKLPETAPLKDLYGDAFQIKGSDTMRANPMNSDLLLVSAAYAVVPSTAPKDPLGVASGFFLYEVRSKRRTILCPVDQWGRSGEWSRDGLQVFYSRMIPGTGTSTFRIFWDGTGNQKYAAGTGLVVGQ